MPNDTQAAMGAAGAAQTRVRINVDDTSLADAVYAVYAKVKDSACSTATAACRLDQELDVKHATRLAASRAVLQGMGWANPVAADHWAEVALGFSAGAGARVEAELRRLSRAWNMPSPQEMSTKRQGDAVPGIQVALLPAPNPSELLPMALDANVQDSVLLLVGLGNGEHTLLGSMLARLLGQTGDPAVDGLPDLRDLKLIPAFGQAMQALSAQAQVLAYRPVDERGLIFCAGEMARTGQLGLALNVDTLVIEGDGVNDGRMDSGEVKNWTEQIPGLRHELTLRALFSAEPGIVLQIRRSDRAAVMEVLRRHGLAGRSLFIGSPRPESSPIEQGKGQLSVWRDARQIYAQALDQLSEAPGAHARGAASEAADEAGPAATLPLRAV